MVMRLAHVKCIPESLAELPAERNAVQSKDAIPQYVLDCPVGPYPISQCGMHSAADLTHHAILRHAGIRH